MPVSPRLTRKLVHPDHDERLSTLFFTPDGRSILCACPKSGRAQIWNAHTGEQIRTLQFPSRSLSTKPITQAGSPTLAPDGRTLFVPFAKYQLSSSSKDGKTHSRYEVIEGEILKWDVASGQQLPSLKQSPLHAVFAAKVSPDGGTLLVLGFVGDDTASGYKDSLTRWNTRTGEHQYLLDGRCYPVFAPDGKTFAASLVDVRASRSKVTLRDVSSGKERQTFAQTDKGLVSGTAFSPDGRYLSGIQDFRATKEPAEVKLWEVATGKEVGSFAAPMGTTTFRRPGIIYYAFNAPAFSPDGRWLAACLHTGRIYLYDVAGRKLAWSQDVKNGYLRELAFSPDGRWLAVVGQDSPEDLKPREEVSPFDLPQPRIFLFDMKAVGQVEEIVAPHGLIGRFAFSPDSKTLALGGSGCVWLFDVSRP